MELQPLLCTNVLFIESGQAGGGSFYSLADLLGGVDRELFNPFVVFFNHTSFIERLNQITSVFVLRDRQFSFDTSVAFRKFYGRTALCLAVLSSTLSIGYQRWLHGPVLNGLGRICNENSISLIYLNNQVNRDFFGVLLARKLGLPVISHLRSMHGMGFCPSMAKIANETVNCFVANSQATKSYWAGLGLGLDKIKVIPNAVPVSDDFGIDPRQHFGISANTRVVGCVGRLVHRKGHAFLISSFARLLKKRPLCILLIIGDGPCMKDIRKVAVNEGVADHVLFAGHQDDARRFMKGMDVLVLPSEDEGFGRVLVEAMGQGTPVIGTKIESIEEIIENGHDGLLVPYGDESCLAVAMESILDDEQLAKRLSQAGKRKAAQQYSMTRHIERVEATMLKVLRTATKHKKPTEGLAKKTIL